MVCRQTHRHTIGSHGMWCLAAAALVLTYSTTSPGSLITLSASCDYQNYPGAPTTTAQASCILVILSPVYRQNPVYLTRGWKCVSTLPDGRKITRIDTAANGMLVRAFVWIDGQVMLVDGIQLSDGRIWHTGQALPRADEPIQSPL